MLDLFREIESFSQECYVDFQAVDVPLLESVAKLTKDADDSEEEDEFGYTKSREH